MAYHFPSGGKRVAKPKTPAQPETELPEEKSQLLQKPAEQEVPQPELKETVIVQAAPKQESAPVQQLPKAEPQKPVEERGKGVAIRDVAIGNFFPIFHTFYDDHPIGKLTLRNTEYSPVTDITVSMNIRQYMDAPKECAAFRELKQGDPDLASRFAYLDLKGEEAIRAADISQVKDLIIWQE